MRKLTALIVAGLITAPVTAFAAAYGASGCGLGSIVFGDDPGIVQIFAATTNGTFGNQTFGITTGTSNCVDAAASSGLDQEAFMKLNYASVVRDAAVGRGEYLTAFATLLGCEPTTHAQVFHLAQAHQGDIFTAQTTPVEALQKFKTTASEDPVLAASCGRI